MRDYEPFILTFKNSLSKDQCKEIIERYEADVEGHYPGVTFKGHNPSVKKTTDLFLSTRPNWKDIDNLLYGALHNALEDYFIKVPPEYDFKGCWAGFSDKGYQIQRYNKKEGFYVWHNDFDVNANGEFRILTFLWYLNDVEEGGETEFISGMKIKPEAGKLLIFPATWSLKHRGHMPLSNDKYIITGWIYTKFPRDMRHKAQTQEEIAEENRKKQMCSISRVIKRKREEIEPGHFIEEKCDEENETFDIKDCKTLKE